jgi:hypothetical protein
VRDALVGADRGVPDDAGVGVAGGLVQGVAADPDAQRGAGDPLGVQAVEYLPEPIALGADEPVGVDPDVVEEEGELPLGEGDRYRQRSRGQAGGVGVDDE